MKTLLTFCAALSGSVLLSAEPNTLTPDEKAAGWELLFDGRTLNGWRASDAPGSYVIENGWLEVRLIDRDADGNPKTTFTVQDGEIVVHGARSHLFYMGPVHAHTWKNFEFSCEVKTWPKANSGVYFHTLWQELGFPDNGFEVQVDNSHRDPKRTAGLYDIKDNYDAVAKDGEWFTMTIRVEGKHVVTAVNGKVVTDWTQPEDFKPPANHAHRVIAEGTFALQGHDPGSETHFRSLKVRALP